MVVLLAGVFFLVGAMPALSAEVVKIGLNYPRTGPYFVQGLDQLRAAEMARDEINAAGGIMGKKIEIVWRDSQSKVDVTKKNVTELIDKEGVRMVFGGSASSVAIAAGEIAQEKGVLFFGTLTYSTDTTGKDGHRHTFRECYDSWMGAKALAPYLKKNFPGKKYFYITSDYTWGWTTEEALRKLTGTADKAQHPGALTPFPTAAEKDFKAALEKAKAANPDVLVIVLFGTDMSNAVSMARHMGLKDKMQIVVPNLTLGMAESAGPQAMEGVIGALPWAWNIPYQKNYARGKEFVEKFASKYNRYPDTSGGSAYAIMHEYKAAVERAGTFDTPAVIKALEGHEYQLLKDKQVWRKFDHQSVQTVYAVKIKPAAQIMKDKYKLDYFEIIDSMAGSEAAVTLKEWQANRTAAGKPAQLEKLPGEK
ncbi:MAG: substrate-binding protein [Nitrospirae bacterium]|nr:substrate-binding protein [Nitrospirota bacterium]